MKRKYFNINVSMFFINKNVEWFEIVNFYKKIPIILDNYEN